MNETSQALLRNHQIKILEVPPMIGGRFSVLTNVGLFCAKFLGVPVKHILQGALDFTQSLEKAKLVQQHAAWLYELYEDGHDELVMMPYSSKLRSFSRWFIQLWAESLGKKRRDGEEIGITPIESHGATDQHSQMQLFMEGPRNKSIHFIEVKNKTQKLSLYSELNIPSVKKLTPFEMNQLIHAQLAGTIDALKEMKRPVAKITIEKLDEFHLGTLILYTQTLTAVLGHMLEIDPFNQPGVELGKKYAYQYLIEK